MRSKLCSRLGAALVAVVMFPVVLAWLLARVLLADIFDDIGNALWGGIASVLDAVKDFVIGLVRHFVNGVTWLVNNLVGIVWSALTSLWASTVQWVHDLWTGVYWVLNTAWSAIQATYNTLVSLVDQAWHAMVGIVGNLWSVVSTLASWTEKAIGDTVAWVVHLTP